MGAADRFQECADRGKSVQARTGSVSEGDREAVQCLREGREADAEAERVKAEAERVKKEEAQRQLLKKFPEAAAKRRAAFKDITECPLPAIGAPEEDILKWTQCWTGPEYTPTFYITAINTTVTGHVVSKQYVIRRGLVYIYVTNGRITAIQY